MIEINQRAFEGAVQYALTEVGLVLHDEIVKVTPRDLERLPINTIDRKDGQPPRRRSGPKPVQILGNWYEWVTGNLKRSIAHGVDRKWYSVNVGVTSSGPAANYAKYLEYGTARMAPRSFLQKTIEDPRIQEKLAQAFENAFFQRLEKYNK
jgi:HK97 gp10 family phage protein